MLPIPSSTAIACFFAVLLTLTWGSLFGSLAATTLGVAGALGLCTAFAATMPIGRRVRRQRLEFAWWLASGEPGSGGGAVVPGAPFEVRCFLRHRGSHPLLLGSLEPVVPLAAKREVERDVETLALAPMARTEWVFRFSAPAIGRVVLHGLAVTLRGPLGLFSVPLYFPNPLVIKVLPQSAARIPRAPRAIPGLPLERSGRSVIAPHGGGTELRELREMVPGDPFKSIAWRPSARRGKLLVREVDQEVQETRYVVLDVSGTMRGGAPGTRKLDHAIEAVAAEARRTLSGGDRFGVLAVDGRILANVAPRDGAPHLLRVFEALLSVTEVVDRDLTDVDDDEVVGIVGRYIRQQDGVDFVSSPRSSEWNVPLLVRHVSKALATEPQRPGDAPLAASPQGVVLRRFCRVRGIPLPYRPDPRDGGKAIGLAMALKEISSRSLGPLSVSIVTDLDGLGEPAAFVSSIELLRMRGHTVVVVVPDAPAMAGVPDEPLEKTLYSIYARGERRRQEAMRALLGPLGVHVRVVTDKDPPALWLGASRRVKTARPRALAT
jgi:uncharacterized protein (DUF58 family)